jgi:hypothetical protein
MSGRRPSLDNIDAEIFSLVGKYPVASIRVIAEALAVSGSTVYSHLSLVEKPCHRGKTLSRGEKPSLGTTVYFQNHLSLER